MIQRLRHGRPADPEPGSFPRAVPEVARPRARAGELAATWVGHSTVLLQVGGLNVLTDPVWGDRASPVAFAGPKRWMPPGLALDALPPLDLVLLSHNHYDHFDVDTIRALATSHPSARWQVPLGLAEPVRALGVREVTEHDWWDERTLDMGEAGEVTVGCTPAQHFSARGLHDRDRTLWCGFTLRVGERRIYFAGDTGLHPEFGAIARRFGPFDLALVPVGAYEPRWFMGPVHMNPEDALVACAELAAAQPDHPLAVLPIHWGTFKLTDEPMDEPPRRTRERWRDAGLPDESLWLLRHGETRRV